MTKLEMAIKVLEVYDKEDPPLFEGIGEVNANLVAVALAEYVAFLTKLVNQLEGRDEK